MCLFLYVVVVVVDTVYFSFFQCSWFSVSSSVFFPILHLLFFAFYTLDFVTYMFETPFLFSFFFFFFFTEISLPSIRNGTYVMYGTYIEPTLLHFCLVAFYSCYFVENSKSAGRKTVIKCGLIWAPSTRIRRKKMRFQKCPDSCGHGL